MACCKRASSTDKISPRCQQALKGKRLQGLFHVRPGGVLGEDGATADLEALRLGARERVVARMVAGSRPVSVGLLPRCSSKGHQPAARRLRTAARPRRPTGSAGQERMALARASEAWSRQRIYQPKPENSPALLSSTHPRRRILQK